MGRFQGKKVGATKIQLTGGAQEVFDTPPEIDQIVSLVVDGRVSGVDYRVNERSGELDQIVRVKVIDMGELTLQATPGLTIVNGQVATP